MSSKTPQRPSRDGEELTYRPRAALWLQELYQDDPETNILVVTDIQA